MRDRHLWCHWCDRCQLSFALPLMCTRRQSSVDPKRWPSLICNNYWNTLSITWVMRDFWVRYYKFRVSCAKCEVSVKSADYGLDSGLLWTQGQSTAPSDRWYICYLCDFGLTSHWWRYVWVVCDVWVDDLFVMSSHWSHVFGKWRQTLGQTLL